jgi:prepilin-type N-terminal cleavage/methylation domain-containing protein
MNAEKKLRIAKCGLRIRRQAAARHAPFAVQSALRNPHSAFVLSLHSAIRNPQSAFTLIEMLVVLGIIGLVAAITLPMIVPIMRTRALDSAVDTVKTACILARSTAIQQRKMVNLTLLQQTDSSHGPGVVMTGYNFAGAVTATGTVNSFTDNNQNWVTNCFLNCHVLLFTPGTPTPQQGTIQSNSNNTISTLPNTAWSSSATYCVGNMVSNGGVGYVCIQDNSGPAYQPPNPSYWQSLSWSSLPQPGNIYVIMSSMSSALPYCIHYPGNYGFNFYNGVNTIAPDDLRFSVLKTFSQYMGETIQYLPQGCQFDFTAPYNAWSSATQYTPGNTVADRGTVYYCLQNHLNREPPNTIFWQGLTAWTYVFLPDGEAWTLLPPAQNVRDPNWYLTTYMYNGSVSGPKIWGPQNLTSATIIVYGTTGQVISQ